MQDFIRRLKVLSVGLFYMGKEKVEEYVADLIRKGEITEKEGRALVNEMVAKSKEMSKDLEDRIHKVMSDAQEKLHAPLRKEINELKQKVARLEKEAAAAKARGRKKAAAAPKASVKK